MQLCDSLFCFFHFMWTIVGHNFVYLRRPELEFDGYYARREKSLVRAVLIKMYLGLLARTRVHAPCKIILFAFTTFTLSLLTPCE